MRVTVPRRKGIEEFLRHMFYRRVAEDDETVTYEGAFPFSLSFSKHEVPRGEREAFYRSIKVEGGFKSRYPDRIDVTPNMGKLVTFRIPKELFNLFKEYVKAHKTTVSEHLRLRIIGDVMDWMKLMEQTKKARVRRAKLKKMTEEQKHEEPVMFG